MKDDNIKRFFDDHKQSIVDEGFSQRLFATLDCLPEPKQERDKSKIVMLLFTLFGFILFVFLGGYGELIKGLVSIGDVVANFSLLSPEIVVAVLFTLCSVFAVGKFAVES
ncbi:MAG: hypothetical protein CVU10_07415 [Bacteroidetes bacterium HGW-Bacteroidetes-5]|jgi:hypothetical protein|nr:MAG: hypothetical protein CVU10_07415 [Bacteroidetes bacterium HGW-Bacteroidetes-5]